jgi:Xaa-Pro aminopeptidase
LDHPLARQYRQSARLIEKRRIRVSEQLIPTFSRQERDRRWGLVRKRMAAEKLDCLVGLPNQGRFEQLQANTRYLTQMGGFACEVAVVFPLAGEVTGIVQTPRDISWWTRAQDWISDLRGSRRLWSEAVITRLKELKITRGRVGVIGLKGLIRAPEGVVPWAMFENLRAALPEVEFVSATHIILETRAVKSTEEIAFIAEASRIAEMAVDTMMATARAGVPENVVYAGMLNTMVANGGELPTMIYWGAGPAPVAEHLVPSRRPLQPGDVLSNEIEAKWGGYIAQVAGPAVIGPIPKAQQALYDVSRGIFDALCELIRPGTPIVEIGRAYQRMAKEAGHNPTAWPFHGRGLGDDIPVMPSAAMESDAVFEAGHVLILKPGVMPSVGGEDAAERAGDTVQVTASGARRFGQRPLRITELPLR